MSREAGKCESFWQFPTDNYSHIGQVGEPLTSIGLWAVDGNSLEEIDLMEIQIFLITILIFIL